MYEPIATHNVIPGGKSVRPVASNRESLLQKFLFVGSGFRFNAGVEIVSANHNGYVDHSVSRKSAGRSRLRFQLCLFPFLFNGPGIHAAAYPRLG